jgi:hypothetical protein
VKKLPSKLFEMSQQGVSEAKIQFIFDALVHAEENGSRFVNVYDDGEEEPKLLFTNDLKQADQQLRFFADRVGCPVIGFVDSGDTWEERDPAR